MATGPGFWASIRPSSRSRCSSAAPIRRRFRNARASALRASHRKLPTVLNGGVPSIEAACEHLKRVDGVMLGRAAYQEPWRLMQADPLLFGEAAPFNSPKDAALVLIPYIERELARGSKLHAITRHVLGLFHGVPGARAFRRDLAAEAVQP